MRRTVAYLVAVTALLAPKLARAQAISAGLGGNASSMVGQPVDIPVIVDMTGRPDRLGAFALTIRWKPSVLLFQQGLGGTFGTVTANTDSVAQGVIRLTGANPAGVGGLVTLGIGRFVPLTADTTTLALSFSQLYAAGTFADLRPSLTVASGEYCSAVGRYGDINGDGLVNSADALIALTNAVGLPTGAYPIALGDVDSSGVTDTRDALIMLSDAVGIDVSAFPRVDRMLGGACATAAPVTIAIAPTTVSGVLPGQEVGFEARATGPTGALMTLQNAVFRSSDTTVLAFEGPATPNVALARAAGSVTVTAVRDGKDSTQTTVTVVARRTTHWVDAQAASAPNQIGTQALPFGTIAAALAIAHAGDTIRPQPGRYEESVVADSAIVLLGDTLADGTRPVLAGNTVGIALLGQGTSELQYLELDGFADAITVSGPSQVLLRGIRAIGVGYGVLTGAGTIARLQIESSRLTGRGPSVAADGVNLGSTLVDTFVVEGTEISDFADGIYGNEVLSVAVHGSSLHDLGGSGVDASCEAPLAFVMDSTSVVNTYSWSVTVSGVSSASFSHNRFFNLPVGNNYTGYQTGVQVLGKGWVRFEGDSINQTGSDPEWLNVNGNDSLRIDSVWARLPNGYGYTLDVPLVRVTNSQFVDLTGQALNVNFYGGGGTVALDNVTATGDPGCDLCATAFQIYYAATTITNFAGSNLYAGVIAYDSSLTVTGSAFQQVAQPISWSLETPGTGAHLLVHANQFVGFSTAVVASLGSVTVDSNTFQASQSPALELDNSEGSVQIVGNTFAGVYGAVNLSPVGSLPVAIAGNSMTGISGYGVIGGGGADTANVGYAVTANQVACSVVGTGVYGIEIENADAAVAGNVVQGCGGGIVVSAFMAPTATPHVMDITGNSVTVPAVQSGAYGGIVVQGMVEAHVASNTVSADTSGYYSTNGDIAVLGDSTSGGLVIAIVDSNVVAGGRGVGIHVAGVDSAAVLFNTVQSVAQAGGCGGCGDGGIWVSGPIRSGATLHGNLVRGILGTGITASNSEDVTVTVDSNLVSGNVIGLALGEYGGLGPVHVTRNRITGNTAPAGQNAYGVVFYYANAATSVVDSNNIYGNKWGATTVDGNYYSMPNNWWGDPSGPACVPQSEPCSFGAIGDSVASQNINPWPWLSSPLPSDLPLSVPPMRMASGLRLPAARLLAAVPRGAPITHAVAAPRWTPRAASSRASAALRVPAGLKAGQADALRQLWDRREARLTAQTQAQAARASRVAAGAAARAAWIKSVERATAQRDSLRAERVREQIAAQRALHARRP